MSPDRAIVRQAGLRLVASLSLLVLLIALSSAGLYRAALHKAAGERAAELTAFYQARLAQLEREWEIQSRDFKVRIEFTRMLEQPATATTNLQAFITIQGTDRRFQYLLIEERAGRKLFDYGKDLALDRIPATADAPLGHYLDPHSGQLYRVFVDRIWLGGERGMGRFAVFYRMDNALLNQIGSPGITLTLLHDGTPLASSGGEAAVERLRRGELPEGAEVRQLPWSPLGGENISLHLEAPVRTLFTTAELSVAMSAIPLVDGLILWLTIGVWLLRQTKRIAKLGEAVHEYAVAQRVGEGLYERLTAAGRGERDEISAVAAALAELVVSVDQRERALHEAKVAAEAANRAKGEFLANMSHEIRTPMNAILGLAYLAQQSDLTPTQADYLAKIRSSAQALLTIINDILNFSKVEAGRLALERVPFRLDELLADLATVAAMTVADKEIEVLFAVAPGTPAALVGDGLRLRQVLTNLIANAVKFTERGEVAVRVAPERVETTEAVLRFTVRDSGIGIGREQQAGLFQAFSQADASTTRRYGGTGLGLAICHRLVTLMGGGIGVESEPGRGSTFSFTARFEPAAAAAQEGRPHGLRLAVEHPATGAALAESARYLGWHPTVVAAGDAAATVTAAPSGYDLALLDGAGGGETARLLRALPGAPPVLVAVTAFGRDRAAAALAGLDRTGVAIKPLTPLPLSAAAAALLTGTPAPAPTTAPPLAAPLAGLHLLVAEDNAINRQVARELLERAGAVVATAVDGERAVALLADPGYPVDAVLLDVQMPVLDGLAAARAIRALPHRRGLPLLAMTANAMTEDRDRCLAAGMDDYLAKPLDAARLTATVARWCRRPRPAAPPAAPPPPPLPAIAGFDTAAALERLDGDSHLLATLLDRFAASGGDLADRLRAAVSAGELEEVRHLAHRLAGTAGNLGADVLQAAAVTLERAARAGAAAAVEAAAAPLHALLPPLLAAAAAGARQLAAAPAETAAVPLLRELEELLANHNLDALERLEPLRQALAGRGLDEAVGLLVRSAERLDFPAALAELRRLAAALQETPP